MRLLYLDFRADYYQLVWTVIFFLWFYMEIFFKKYSWSNDCWIKYQKLANSGIIFKIGLSHSTKLFLFTSVKAFWKWWKMLFISF